MSELVAGSGMLEMLNEAKSSGLSSGVDHMPGKREEAYPKSKKVSASLSQRIQKSSVSVINISTPFKWPPIISQVGEENR